MKLTKEEYDTLTFLWGKQKADEVLNLSGWRSAWWQFNYEMGPHHKAWNVIGKILICVVIAVIWGVIPLIWKLFAILYIPILAFAITIIIMLLK